MGLSKKEGGAGRLARTGCVPRRLNVVEIACWRRDLSIVRRRAGSTMSTRSFTRLLDGWWRGRVAECKRAF
jgi:hypothetical protein